MCIMKINPYNGKNSKAMFALHEAKADMIYAYYKTSYLYVASICEVAYGVMIDARADISKTKLFQHQVKQYINESLEKYRKMQKQILKDMGYKTQFWLDYMDAYDELIEPLLNKLKMHFDNIFVKFRHEEYGHEKALMLVAYNILDISCVFFDKFFNDVTEISGKNISDWCSIKAIKNIRKEWALAICKINFVKDFKLDDYKNCKKAIDSIYNFLEDPKSVKIPVETALKLNPDCDLRIKND